MKLLLIGDPHLKINRFELAKSFLVWVNSVVEAERPDLVINLGDTFDTHAVVRSEVMTEFMKHVDAIGSICPYTYLLGNHDMYKPNDAKYHALLHIKDRVPHLKIFDQIQNVDEMGITFVPYQHNPANFPTNTLPICIAHQTFKNADYGDITVKDGVDADSISADVIISGHIHKKQTLGKVLYVGSPFSQSVSDINQVKGLVLFDTVTYETKEIPCPLPMWRGARFEMTPSYGVAEMHEELVYLLTDTKDHWVVEITGPKAEIVGYLDSKLSKKLFEGIDIKVKTVFTDKEKKLTTIKAISIDTIVNEYIDKVYSGSLDKDILKSKSMELLDKSKSK